MTYHTNHCWCSKSNHDGDFFDGGAMVYFGRTLSNDFIDEHLFSEELIDPDFIRLTDNKEFFDEEAFQRRMTVHKENGGELSEEEINKKRENEKLFAISETVSLKQNVIDWLNENIKDRKDSTKDTPINERKAWCTGNDTYNSNEPYNITVFFSRQKDALKFINHFSIYKKPTFYFDYFHNKDTREMDIKDMILLTNEYNKENNLPILDIGEVINIPHKTSTELNEDTYTMIDWEVDDES